MQELQNIIDNLWQNKAELQQPQFSNQTKAVHKTLALLNQGKLRVCEKVAGVWQVNEWIKKAILLYFQLTEAKLIPSGSDNFFDKIPLKCADWTEEDFRNADFRYAPGAKIRAFSYIGKKCVIMPSFVNIGAYVGGGTMVDAWATIGSCAQIGNNCHISGGVGIGGVLEPLQATPVIIENNVFIGARSEIAEGVIVEQGSVIAMGVYIGASTKIYDRATGHISYGRVPAYSVVVPGSVTSNNTNLYAAIIVKQVNEATRKKTSINQLLRN